MKIKRISHFKKPTDDLRYLENWVTTLEQANQRSYERISVQTDLGKTHVWALNSKEQDLETLVIFPGARTTALFWDLDRGLDRLGIPLRIFMVETNGLPNFSDGATPDIRSLDYGHWANAVVEKLGIQQAFFAGASFGGLICMKMGITHPEKMKAAFLLNPGCLQPFSLTWKNLYYNLLPILMPGRKNTLAFLDKAVFHKPQHQVSAAMEQLVLDYEVFAITRYKDRTQKPYFMGQQLAEVAVNSYLIEGDKDLLFPYKKSIENAQKYLRPLKSVIVMENVGHGIETYALALDYVGKTIQSLIAGTK